MRLDRFDLNLLVVLDALLEERNVTRASPRLHIGPSATSAALGRLRAYFGDELLTPLGRQLRLTPLAQSLVEAVRGALRRARVPITRQPGFDAATVKRRFVVCASDGVTTVQLTQAVRGIAALAPGVTPDVTCAMSTPPRAAHSLSMIAGNWATCRCAWATGRASPLESGPCPAMAANGGWNAGWTTSARRLCWRWARSLSSPCTTGWLSILRSTVRMVQAPFEMPPLLQLMAWPRHLAHDPAHAWLLGQVPGRAETMNR